MPASRRPWAAWCLALLLAAACQPDRAIPGKYLAPGPGDHPESQVALTLHPTGKGSWSYNDEEVPLQWESRPGQVLLHLKGGGLIVGRDAGQGVIELDLPGLGPISFRCSGP